MFIRYRKLCFFFLILVLGLWCGPRSRADGQAAISYSRDVAPIFRNNCQGCHQPAKAGGELVMTTLAGLMAKGESGNPAIVAGSPDSSYLMHQITPDGDSAEMPKNAAPLTEQEIATIRTWIEQGAEYDASPEDAKYSSENPPAYSRPPVTTALAASPDGKWLAMSGFQEALVVDAITLEPVQRLVGLSERIESLSFSPDSLRLAVTGGSPGRLGEVQVWAIESGTLEVSEHFGFDTISGGRFSPDGTKIVFGCSDNTLRAIDSVTGKQVLHQGAHEDWIRACVFTPDGKNIVSAARDMTVKLTEVETQRFVDNITSITPGALRGGVNSLAMHPERNEFLVGGADGTPKVYRVFRETERRIGDDANLVRQFPAMPGRIFSVAISQDGKRLAAASTLDGVSQIRVYPYSFDSVLPEDVKAVMAKRVAERKAEENKLVEDYIHDVPEPLFSVDLPATSIYAISFSQAGQRLVAGGSDGILRSYDCQSGELLSECVPVPISDAVAEANNQGTVLAVANGLQANVPGLSDELPPAAEAITQLTVQPPVMHFSSPDQYGQLVVTALTDSGASYDVSRHASFTSPDALVSVAAGGLVRPAATGKGEVDIEFAGRSVSISVICQLEKSKAVPDFVQDVNPLLSRLGCNSGMCHGSQKGKNGFKLSLRGYDPLEDIRALSDDLVSRRLNTAAPDASLMLLKTLGVVPHEGGVLLSRDSVYYSVLRDWIAAGAPLNPDSRKVSRIELYPKKPVIEREGGWQQFRVMAFFPDGSSRDVTREAFIETGNAEVCVSHPTAIVQAIRRGEAPILARYEGAYAAATVTVMGDRSGFAWQEPPTPSRIDALVATKWQRMKILPSDLCSDADFARRIHLDLTGLPPESAVLKDFLSDTTPSAEKRSKLIERLIGNPDYVDHWTNKWADLLQVNSKFLGGPGAKAYREWIHTAIDENRPYDQFAREVITASGSNKDNPAASYFKILREPDMMMENTTHLFLAVRFNCNKCHDHPFERWTQDQYYELAAFFAQTGLKEDPQSNGKKLGGTAVEGAKPLYELITDNSEGEMTHVRTGKPVAPSFPYDCDFEADEDATRREQLAAWMTSPDNPYFATSFVNRIWGYMTGTGIMMPLDDIRAGNPPTNPELLEFLTKEFVESGFDTEHLIRQICNSRTYQLAISTNVWNEDDDLNYSHAKARRLPAEVLYDAVYQVTGAVSQIPGVAPGTRAAALPDVAFQLSDGFLNNLGRPVRESACECERSDGLQLGPIMALVSGPTIGTAISDPECELPKMAEGELSLDEMIREIYFRVLSRPATDAEVTAVADSVREIDLDHTRLGKQLAERESWWIGRHQELEAQRLARLDAAKRANADRTESIAEARQLAEQQRLVKLEAAEAELAAYAASSLEVAGKYLDAAGANANWFPLAPAEITASNQAKFAVLEDRSIVASGNADKGSYTLSFHTPLRGIRGLRLEALPVEGLIGGGPGLPANGNFVVTELEVEAAPLGKPDAKKRITLTKGQADFSQSGFDPAQVYDGKTGDQRGWAVSPQGGIVHWATFQTAEPIDMEGAAQLTITIHQNHSAAEHRLARFRISVTTDAGDIPLGLPESFAMHRLLAKEMRNKDSLASLVAYLSQNDKQMQKLKAAVAAAKMPLPEDEQLLALRKQVKALETETPADPQLVRLRSDFDVSQQQLGNQRLTLAQDLTWALINSPAFLFNR